MYVHDPAASSTSTSASFSQRNYQIDPGSAWKQLIEVQGFGQRYVDAGGATLGTAQISANQISRFITFSVPKATLGTPTSGWSFAPTPQGFQFGVCATASDDAHCTADPATVPKTIDALTPPGILQSDELDYTQHDPVTIQGVTMP